MNLIPVNLIILTTLSFLLLLIGGLIFVLLFIRYTGPSRIPLQRIGYCPYCGAETFSEVHCPQCGLALPPPVDIPSEGRWGWTFALVLGVMILLQLVWTFAFHQSR